MHTIEFSVVTIIMILYLFSTILDHLFNWWLRVAANDLYDSEGSHLTFAVFTYLAKVVIMGIAFISVVS